MNRCLECDDYTDNPSGLCNRCCRRKAHEDVRNFL